MSHRINNLARSRSQSAAGSLINLACGRRESGAECRASAAILRMIKNLIDPIIERLQQVADAVCRAVIDNDNLYVFNRARSHSLHDAPNYSKFIVAKNHNRKRHAN